MTNFCLFYVSFADLEPKNQGFFSENNRQGCQNCSPRVHGDILQGFFFRKVFFYLIIGHWSTFVCHFDGKLSLPLSVLFSVCQLDQFLVKNVCRKFFLHHLRTFSKDLSVFFRKSFGQLNKTAFHVSRGKIWGQNIVLTKMLFVFFHVLPKLNGEITVFFCQKNNRQICHICLPRIQEDFLKKFFLIKFFFFHHWALSNFCMSFRRNFVSPDVSTVFCLSIRPVSGEKCLSKIFSPSFTDIQQKFVCFFSENLSFNLTKLLSTCPEEKFEDKTLFWQRCCLFFFMFFRNWTEK